MCLMFPHHPDPTPVALPQLPPAPQGWGHDGDTPPKPTAVMPWGSRCLRTGDGVGCSRCSPRHPPQQPPSPDPSVAILGALTAPSQCPPTHGGGLRMPTKVQINGLHAINSSDELIVPPIHLGHNKKKILPQCRRDVGVHPTYPHPGGCGCPSHPAVGCGCPHTFYPADLPPHPMGGQWVNGWGSTTTRH